MDIRDSHASRSHMKKAIRALGTQQCVVTHIAEVAEADIIPS